MKFSVVLSVLSAAVSAYAATVSLDPIGFQGDGLSGTVVGTGASDTTFVLSGTASVGGAPVTVTYIQGSDHISETADIPAQSLSVGAACSFSDAGAAGTQGQCVLFDAGPTATTTSTLSVQINLTPVPVEGSVSAASTTGTSNSTSSTSTNSQQTITSAPSPTAPTTSSPASTSSSTTSGAQKVYASGAWALAAAAMAVFLY